MTCESGLSAPQGLLDGLWAYGVTACGFVVRAPKGPYLRGESDELQQALDGHYAAAHPRRWREIQTDRAISAD